MITQKKRLRSIYEPLTVTCQVLPSDSGAPLNQVYHSATGEYIPSREGVTGLASILSPIVSAYTKDNTWQNRRINSILGTVSWKVNGQPIENVWSATDYNINMSSTDRRGELTIRKNVAPDTQTVIGFEATFTDPRTGDNYTVRAKDIVLSTTTAAPDEFSVGVSKDVVYYDMFLDRLVERDYCVANNITPDMSEADALKVGTPYRQRFAFTFYKGKGKTTPTASEVKVYKLVDGNYVQLTTDMDEVLALTRDYIDLDCRLVALNERYRVEYTPAEGNRCYDDFSIVRTTSAFDVMYINTADIDTNETTRKIDVRITTKGKTSRTLPHPEAQLTLQWMTDSVNATEVRHNQGSHGIIDISRAQPGDTQATNWLDIYLDINYRGQAAIMTLDQARATDNGSTLIG